MTFAESVRRVGCLALASVLTVPATVSAGESPAGKRPNVIFLLADDLGWGDLGGYGNRLIKTPHLDRLAAEGTRFTNFYACGSVCSPSRAALMTGRFPARVRIHSALGGENRPGSTIQQQNARQGMPNFLDPAVPTLTHLLQKSGYAVAHVGKWHLGSGRDVPEPSAYGIDAYKCVNCTQAGWDTGDPFFRARSSELFVDETIRFIESNRDRPFFVQTWFLLPHATLNPTEEQMKPYAVHSPRGVPHHGAMQIYYASVTALDAAVGRLLERLDAMGLASNTLIFFSSDNGPEDIHIPNASHSAVGSPGPFRGRKRSLYEGGIRVPLIVRWPAHTPAGAVDDATIMGGCDLLPTLCSITGVEPPPDLDGQDMTDPLLGRTVARKRPLLWEWRFGIAGDIINKSPALAIRDGQWKLLLNPDRSRVELYDLTSDPTEVDNRAAEHPDVVERLSEPLLAWKSRLPPGQSDRDVGSNAYPWPRPEKVRSSQR